MNGKEVGADASLFSDVPLVSSPAGLMAALLGVCAFFFFLERATRWRLFHFLPPLLFIYAVPIVLSNTGVIAGASPVYDSIGQLALPVMLVLLLLKVDVASAVRVMGRGVFVMLFGTLGVVVGAPIAYWLARGWLGPEAWKAYGILAGSWIGGTANMNAMAEMLDAREGAEFGLAVLGDTTIYVVWLPLLLMSKHLAGHFGRFTRVSSDRLQRMEEAAQSVVKDDSPAEHRHLLYLLAIAFAVSWAADGVASLLPEFPAEEPIVTASTWRILAVTTMGIGLSLTPLKKIPGSHELAMAFVYLFVARMGATAQLSGIASQAVPFLLSAFVWIFIHGCFCLLGAWLLRVDVHTAAIASAANIGGAASTPIVAAYHKESLVPAGILMALIGYAVGNYAAFVAAQLCRLLAP